jgi:chemotaxis signal transduction protein
LRALLLRLGEDAFVVPMDTAREVVASPEVTALPSAPASVLGVCNVRGEIIPVFDTGVLLGLAPMASFGAIAVIETALGPAGMAMSDIGESVEVGEAVATSETPGTAGVYSVDSRVAVLVDLEALLAPVRGG